MKHPKKIISTLAVMFLCSGLMAQIITIDEKTEGMKKYPGYFTFYWDNTSGKIWLEIDKFDKEFLYVNSVSGGLAANGIDRNQLGQTKLVKFNRIGPKILMIQPNYSYRANTDNKFVKEAVENAFGKSVIWGFKVAAEQNGKVLVDATNFLLRDARGWASSLGGRNGGGSYRFDESKSAFYLPNTKNFPENSEFETILTYTGNGFRGKEAPSTEAITLKLHQSLVKLPDNDYIPRRFDPRSSYMSMSYMDFAIPFGEEIVQKFIVRHRLKKKNPSAKISEPVEPIIYYVDRGTPDDIIDAVIEGAGWWNNAFEACGYKNAFLVKLLPEDADPMDTRYNMINWVNRTNRGWSYGGAISDPRTGEIIKGNVSMGALRIRQAYLIATGLAGEYTEGNKISGEMKKMALQRIRQLSAHEVGHTIGLVHNYASNVDERSSVMDYPHSLAKIKNDGSIDLSDAYTNDIGEWDKISIAYGYQDFPEGTDHNIAAKEKLDKEFKKGIFYLTDKDAGANIHPLAHQWVNGKHPVDELERVMKIRKIALDNFSEKKIKYGDAMSTLENVLVPVYFYHRFQIKASSAVLGGLYYNHALRGGPQYVQKYVPAEEQQRALQVLLSTIKPENLKIDERILKLIPPRAPGHDQTPDLFNGYAGGLFDPLAAAENIADMTVGYILDGARATRLIEFNARNENLPGLGEVIDKLINSTFNNTPVNKYDAEIQRTVNNVVVNKLIALAANANTSSQARAMALLKLTELPGKLYQEPDNTDENQRAHIIYCLNKIERFLLNPESFQQETSVKIPNGAPIGNK
ncbi:zinc-dependent metalloprotease [Bacteroidota bacterium]